VQDNYRGQQEDTRSRVLDYFQLIWYRRRFVLLVTAVVVILSGFWLSVQQPVYRATATLRIGLPDTPESTGAGAAHGGAAIDEISGEMEVLSSRKLASTLVAQIQLQFYPELNPEGNLDTGFLPSAWGRLKHWLSGGDAEENSIPEKEYADATVLSRVVDRVLERLTVERVGTSRVVKVTFQSRDPGLSVRVANALSEAYIAARQQARIEASASSADFAAEQFLQLQERLAASERAEAYYRNTLPVEEVERIDQLKQQMSDLNSQLVIDRARRDDALDQLGLLENLSVEGRLTPEMLDRLDSPEIGRLVERHAQLDQRVADLVAGEPELAQTNEDIAAANAAGRLELDRLVSALQKEASQASERVVFLESELAALKLESSMQHRRLLQLRELEKETAINRLRFEAAAERIRGGGVSAELVRPDTELLSGATLSHKPLYPGRSQKLLLSALGGFGLGLLLVLIRQKRNPGLLSPEHVHFVLGENTVGVIPEAEGKVPPHELILDAPKSDFSAAVAALKITLGLADLEEPVRVVQLVSSMPGEGRASLAVALARSVASEGRKVLLVSGHLRHSTIEGKIGASNQAPGLTDLLLEDEPRLEPFLQHDHRSKVRLLSAGTAEYANPDVVFSSQRMRTVVERMRSEFDFIVFDTPPVMSTTEAISIGRLVDKTLFVVQWNKTSKALVAEALKQLRAGGLDMAGVVLQHVNLQRYGNIEFSDYGYLYHQKR
jgi:capsular exopolysaccharide synthesis family protein